jgi:hypothetical protein
MVQSRSCYKSLKKNNSPILLICPGIHQSIWTEDFLTSLKQVGLKIEDFHLRVFPTENFPAYSGLHILHFLLTSFNMSSDRFSGSDGFSCIPLRSHDFQKICPEHCFNPEIDCISQLKKFPILIISFSAGVVGAIAAASIWQSIGGTIRAFIALDGWGVPLYGNFPIHRLSHDAFTHYTSSLLGSGEDSFYADPSVAHETLWRSPHPIQAQLFFSLQSLMCLIERRYQLLLLNFCTICCFITPAHHALDALLRKSSVSGGSYYCLLHTLSDYKLLEHSGMQIYHVILQFLSSSTCDKFCG